MASAGFREIRKERILHRGFTSMRKNTLIHASDSLRKCLFLGVLTARLFVPATPHAQHRVIDTEHSTITVHVFKSGLFRAFADDHVIQAPVPRSASE
jgi:hypothetical protein